MASGSLTDVLEYLRNLSGAPAEKDLTDLELLERFRRRREETAFALLLQRHGPMVLAVCRRVLHDREAAEDAFQATFLVLVRKAATIRQQDSLAGWLYRVAHRVSLRARAQAEKRSSRERRSPHMPPHESPDETTWQELRSVLDEELAHLPEKYQTALVLHYLEGKTQEQAARELGVPRSSLASRLARGRELLRGRIARRGLALSAGLLATALATRAAPAAVPALLAIATARLALTSGATGIASAISRRALSLADGAVKSMPATQSKMGLALAALAALAAGSTLATYGMVATPSPPAEATRPEVVSDLAETDEIRQVQQDSTEDPLPKGTRMRLGTTRRRAVGAQLAVTPDGKTVVSVRGGKYITFWDADRGNRRKSLVSPGEHRGIWLLSPRGRWLLTNEGHDGTLTVRDVDTGKAVHHLAVEGAHVIAPIAFSADERLVAGVAHVGNQRLIRAWDLTAEKPVFTQPLDTNFESFLLAFSADGAHLLASFSSDQLGMFCWETATGRQRWQNKDFCPVSMAFTADGKIISSDRRTPVLDLVTGKPVRLPKDPPLSPLGDTRLATMPDGHMVAISTAQGVVLWDSKGEKPPRPLPGAGEEILPFPDGKTVLSGGGLLQRWDVATGKPLWPDTFEAGHVGEVTTVAFSGDGRTLASGSTDGTVRVWDVMTGKPLHVWRAHTAQRPPIGHVALARAGVTVVDLSRDGRYVISGGSEPALEVWNASTGKHVRSLPFPQDNGRPCPSLLNLRIGPDGTRAVGVLRAPFARAGQAATPTWLGSWDLKTGKRLSHLPIELTEVGQGAFSLDGRTLVADGLLIDDHTGRTRCCLEGVDRSTPGLPFAFSRDGALVVGGATHRFRNESRYGDGVTVWEAATGKKTAEVKTWSWVTRVALHPGGRLVATGDAFGVRLWNVETGKQLATPELPENVPSATGSTGCAGCLAFSPDGRSLAIGQSDGTILIWDVAPTNQRSGSLTPGELNRLWDDLKAADAARAWRAAWRLADCPEAAFSLLHARLKPTPSVSMRQIETLLVDLDDRSFSRRETAAERLSALGHAAEPALREALKSRLSPEQKRQVEQLLHSLTERPLSPDELRAVRAVAVLSRIDSPGSRRLLEEWANGPESAPYCRRAREALQGLR